MANRRVLDLKASRLDQGITQFKERDIWVLFDKLLEERHMWCQLT